MPETEINYIILSRSMNFRGLASEFINNKSTEILAQSRHTETFLD